MYRSIKLEFNVENLNNLATIWLTYLGHEKDGSREQSEVVFFLIFSHIRIMDYFRLGMGQEFPKGLGNWPRRVRAPCRVLEIGEKLL